MTNIEWIGSPNFDEGRVDRIGNHNSVELIVIHYMVGDLSSADAIFADPERRTSAHYGIGEGKIHQWVKDEDTAWHAGDYTINTRSIGIEHSAFWDPDKNVIRPPDAATYQASIDLCERLCRQFGLDPSLAIVPHKEFTDTLCPGTADYLYIRKEVRKRISLS